MKEKISAFNDNFGCLVFNEDAMGRYIPETTMEAWKHCVTNHSMLTDGDADIIAEGMKNWAVENGATHYTHWFQPLNGFTAEKHEGFLVPAEDGGYELEFSGKELKKGESDASSLPSGGLRATFEARGYSAWDPTSFAFIKDKTLCIPTIFCSYSGEVLDKKTPLLRSIAALNKQTLRVLSLLGQDAESVTAQVGAEQEYFLINKELFLKRDDLKLCGRTLFGAKPPKTQELSDHYYGTIEPVVSEYMHELDNELWKLGIVSKTEHNEAAPAQHEMAPFYSDCNTANDQNQLTMEIMKKVADKRGLVCLLNEKPFEFVNGSGKHVNWSVSTDKGENLFSPGKTPEKNLRFLLMVAAFLKGVDEYQELLRCATAYAGNDNRLGGNEAPPAIISVFVGSDLQEIIDSIIENGNFRTRDKSYLKIGEDVLLNIPSDTTDRNRTSPVAFTGNKFEFRMPGSAQSIATPVVYLNTIMAQEMKEIADAMENVEADREQALWNLIRSMLAEHKRIIFDGNAYDDRWVSEAAARGLKNLRTAADAFPEYLSEKNIRLLTENGIFSETEMAARNEIHMKSYSNIIEIEARTLSDMVRKKILGAVSAYASSLKGDSRYEKDIASKIRTLGDSLYESIARLDGAVSETKAENSCDELRNCCYVIVPLMKEVRTYIDALEELCDSSYWPYPSYSDMLYST